MAKNTLYYGDNLDILRRYVPDESVDLVYLDPPFKSNQDYNVLFEERNGSKSKAQIKAFEDTWTWDQTAAAAFEETVESAPQPVSQAMQAFKMMLGASDMLAYLSMMAPRLVELRRSRCRCQMQRRPGGLRSPEVEARCGESRRPGGLTRSCLKGGGGCLGAG